MTTEQLKELNLSHDKIATLLSLTAKGISMDNVRVCTVGDDGLEGMVTGLQLLQNPSILNALQIIKSANPQRHIKIEYLILNDDLISSYDEEKEMLSDYFRAETLQRKQAKIKDLEREIQHLQEN